MDLLGIAIFSLFLLVPSIVVVIVGGRILRAIRELREDLIDSGIIGEEKD